MKPTTILLLDCDPGSGSGEALREIIESAPGQPAQVRYERAGGNGAACLQAVRDLCGAANLEPAVVFLVFGRGPGGGVEALFAVLSERWPAAKFVVLVEARRPDELLELLKAGADDFITQPAKPLDVLPRLYRLLSTARPAASLAGTFRERVGMQQFVGESPALLAKVKNIPLVARSDARVLITGETGTGKELCARAIHYLSARADMPFTCVNCGAIPVDLIENELFGHSRGAYTGAVTSERGLIGETDGGTLFLDEIDCLPALAQVKLLRFLQEKEYRPLGHARTCRADVRVIAATNADLEKAVSRSTFRQDFYYRLNVISLTLPPLRERREDIPLLAAHFLKKYTAEFGKPALEFAPRVLERLTQYDWPGNVRELEHVVERAVVLAERGVIEEVDIAPREGGAASRPESFHEAKSKMVAEFEKAYIRKMLAAYRGNITKAAQAARKNRRVFWQLIRKHEINVESFRRAALAD